MADEIYLKVENQQLYETCYTFGTLNMIETYLAKKYNEYFDFSEIHMATATSPSVINNDGSMIVNANFKTGGNIHNLQAYLLKGLGPVLEDEMPYQQFYDISNLESIEEIASNYIVENKDKFTKTVSVNQIVTFADRTKLTSNEQVLENRNRIKYHLQTYGSVCSSIDADSSNTDFVYGSVTYSNTTSTESNHMITIVGWDDNIQLGSFTGGYLCLNSWGENWGNGGYFYVPYDNPLIEKSCYGVSDVTFYSNNTISNFKDNNLKGEQKGFQLASLPSVENNKNRNEVYGIVIDSSNYKGRTINSISTGLLGLGNYNLILNFYEELPTVDNITDLFTSYYQNGYTNIGENRLIYNNRYQQITKSEPINSYYTTADDKVNLYGGQLEHFSLAEEITIPENANYTILVVYVEKFYAMYNFSLSYADNNILNNVYQFTSSNFISYSDSTTSRIVAQIFYLDDFGLSTAEFNTQNSCTISEKKFDNAIYYNNRLNLTFETSLAVSEIKIYKSTIDNYVFNKTLVDANHFEIKNSTTGNVKTIKIKQISETIPKGQYILQFKVGEQVFEKSFAVIESPITQYNINYELNGGENNFDNPIAFQDNASTIKIYSPIKKGYDFLGWFTDESCSSSLTVNLKDSDSIGNFIVYNLPLEKSDIKLYAKWQLKNATILSDISDFEKFYDKSAFKLEVLASHDIADISYEWYYHATSTNKADFTIIPEKTTNYLELVNCIDSGNYYCKITSTYNGETQAFESQFAKITIKKGIYNINWNYTSPFSYNNQEREINLTNLDKYSLDIEILEISGNKKTDAGNYTASVVLNNKNENFEDLTLEDLNWQITPAPLNIKVNDFSTMSEQEFSNFNASNWQSTLLSNIYDEYSPILEYSLISTSNNNLKTISAVCTNPNSNYKIDITYGSLKLVRQNLSSSTAEYTISLYNKEGFLANTDLLIDVKKPQDLDASIQKELEKKDLIVYNIYNINLSESVDTSTKFSISLSKDFKDKNIQIYYLSENGLQLVSSSILDNQISFNSETFGTFLIVEAPVKTNTKTIVIALAIILSATLFCCLMITLIRHNRKKKYSIKNKDFIVH